MKLIGNVNHRLGEDLKEEIKKGSKLVLRRVPFLFMLMKLLKKN